MFKQSYPSFSYLLFCLVSFTSGALLATDEVSNASGEAKPEGVHEYRPEYEEAVKKLAWENMRSLVSVPFTFSNKYNTDEYLQKMLNSQVVPTLHDPACFKKVYLKDGQPVGFVTYSPHTPWHRALLPVEVGPNVEVHHLAVSDTYRGSGYGKALMQSVLEDCKKQSVNRVSLWVTYGDKNGVHAFFKKLGFKHANETKLHESEFVLRLKPHPAWVLAGHQLEFARRLKPHPALALAKTMMKFFKR